MKTPFGIARRGPDRLAEELVRALSVATPFAFPELFALVYGRMKAQKQVGCGEEMLRLRAHEKLQNLVHSGVAEKCGKLYSGVPAAVAKYQQDAAEVNHRRDGSGRLPPAASRATPP